MIRLKNLLMEVDWSKFSDVHKVEISAEELMNKLNDNVERLKHPEKNRQERDKGFAYVHPKETHPNGEIKNIEQFIKTLTKMPDTIFEVGQKSKHSTNEKVLTINTGIPALKAILWDSQLEKFYVISTCPGAGRCAVDCYALKGMYIICAGKNIKLVRRLQLLMDKPDLYEKKASSEIALKAYEARLDDKKLKIRWNDAGDFFCEEYFNIAVRITKTIKDQGFDVESYAYTKIGKMIDLGTKEGMVMSFSSGARGTETGKIDPHEIKYAQKVPRELALGIFKQKGPGFAKDESGKAKFKDSTGKEELRNRIYNEYGTGKHPEIKPFSKESLLYTDELPVTEQSPLSLNVILLPAGDSDVGAQRRDIKNMFLTSH